MKNVDSKIITGISSWCSSVGGKKREQLEEFELPRAEANIKCNSDCTIKRR